MLKKIGLGILGLVALLVIYAALQPADYLISRQVTINAPAEKVFPYLNNQKLADQWGPWKEIDPGTAMVFSGPEAGVGARTSWEGGKQLGTGSATIVESVPNERVGIKLEYTKPFPMTQDAEYSVKASGQQSVVTWVVRGKNAFPGRIMCIFMNMDKTVGGMFEKGLSNLKTLAEK